MEARQMKQLRRFWLLPVGALLAGCGIPTIYSWGHYEDLVYVSYAKPGKIPPQAEVDQLEHDYQKARSANRTSAPGITCAFGLPLCPTGRTG